MSLSASRAVTTCRICGSAELWRFLSLGRTPLANALVRPQDAARPEPTFPLETLRCATCGLVQLSVVVDPAVMFRDYLYATSASAPMLEHFRAYADDAVDRFGLRGTLVVEIGSNDGVLLRSLQRAGARALGVEPARNLAAVANAAGLETVNDFFGSDAARRVAASYGRAHAVIANNVFAHIDDVRGVVAGLDALLADDGVFIAEFPYLGDLIESVEYDTIYHEHLSYLSLAPLDRLFGDAGLELFDVRRVPVHGGSLRAFVARRGRRPAAPGLIAAHEDERRRCLDDNATYESFADRVVRSRESLRSLVGRLRASGQRIAAIGASAKGNTLLNYCGFGPADVEFVADSTEMKQGLLTPGTHIPIRPEAALRDERPDHALLLAWNYAEAILEEFSDYTASGGRFIHPIPLARIIP